MVEPDENQARAQEHDAGEEPQVYSVEKRLGGWSFSRRELLAAAGTAAAAVTAAAVAQKDQAKSAHEAETGGIQAAIALDMATVTMMAVSPAQSFVQLWRFTNESGSAWARGIKLFLLDAGKMRAPASLLVPDIGPGQTHTVHAEMVAPGEPGVYQSSWRLQIARYGAPIASGPLIVQNECIVESPHPYEDNMTRGWAVTNPDEAAQSTRVHFLQVDVLDGDYIILKDDNGTERQRITGSFPSGVWSNRIPGRTVNVELVSDASGTGWGFCLDQVETIHHMYLPFVSRQPTPTPTPIPCLAESPHPYDNDMEQLYVVTNPDPSAQGSRVHFVQVDLEDGWDYLIVKDSSGREYQRITGSYPTGLWSEAVTGRQVHLVLDTDPSVTRWGFCVDRIENTAAPCSCVGYCSCDSVCTCDSVHYWYPN